MSNKKRKIMIIISIIIIIIASIGIAYGVSIIYKREGTTNNKLIVGDIYMRYKEGSALNISNMMPSATYPSKAENNYYEFQIIGKNTNTEGDIEYSLKLAYGNTQSGKNRIADTWLYFKLVEVSNLGTNNETETPVEGANDVHFTTIPNAVIYTATIPKNTTNEITKTYRLYARISDSIRIGNVNQNYTIEQWNNLYASIKVNAEGEYVESYKIACPGEGCYYTWDESSYYTTWNTESQTPTTINPSSLPSGVSTNYNDVVKNNTFIAMRLNSNNQVEHAYACGIEGGTPFCIEGTYSANLDKATIQQANLDVLTPLFGDCSGSVGSNINCSGLLDVYSYSNGAVKITSDSSSLVLTSGSFNCILDALGGPSAPIR